MKKLIDYYNFEKKRLKKKYLALHEPSIDLLDKKSVINGLNSGYVSSAGKEVDTFEKKLKNITKSKFNIATVTGTAALQIALKIIGINKNDEVLLPSIGFVAAANAILYNSGTPHFVDSELNHFGIDWVKLEDYLSKNTIIKNNFCINKKTKNKIKAIIIVHIFGHPARIDKLIKVAKKYRLKVIEDAAEGLGSKYKKKHLGTFGDIGVLSFNGNKIVTTGMGGSILTKNSQYAKKAKHLISTSKIKHKWEFIHDEVGYNYKLPNINASLGISQLNKIKKLLLHKRKLYKKFYHLLKGEDKLKLLNEPKNSLSNFWLQTLIIKNPSTKIRDKFLRIFHKNKILARPIWTPLHKLKFLKNYPKMNLKNTEKIQIMIINIPSSYYFK